MGRLTELLVIHQDLTESLSKLDMRPAVEEKKAILETVKLQNPRVEFLPEAIDRFKEKYNVVLGDTEKIKIDIQEFLDKLIEQIDVLADQLVHSFENRRLSTDLKRFGLVGDRRDIPEDVAENIKSHTSWQYPGLILYPRYRSWIDIMAGSDPLYLVDYDNDVLSNRIQEYPLIYQHRLRLYPSIETLPKNQFGMILMWEFINWLSLDRQFDYLKQSYDLLRPGGVIVFTYNNCDISTMSKVAENNHICYSSSRLLTKFCRELGYEIISDIHIPLDYGLTISWMKIKKPGTLSSIRIQPAVGEIKSKDMENFIKSLARSK